MRRKTLSAIVSGAALAAALTLPSASAATAGPNTGQTFGRWNVASYDFGYAPATISFTLTNTTTTTWIDYPINPHNGHILHWVNDTCTQAIAPGKDCIATIAYTPAAGQQAWKDTLAVAMTDLAGHPIPTPVVQLSGADTN